MVQKLFSRTTACLITLCAVLASVLLGANLTLSRMRQEAWELYLYGLDGNGIGVESDLADAVGEATSLARLSQFYLEEDNSAMQALNRSIDAYNQAHSVSDKGAAASLLGAAVEALNEELDGQELSDNDRSVQKRHVDNARSALLLTRQTGYNEAAKSFNSALRTFPGGSLARLTGVQPLELFE